MQEKQVGSLGWVNPLEKEIATHSSILAWENQWTEEPGGLQSMGLKRVGHDLVTNNKSIYDIGTIILLIAPSLLAKDILMK